MIQTGIESRVKIQDVISSQLPNFILDESPKTADFLRQYYISQEFKSGVVDIAENLDQYLDLDNLTPEVISNNSTLSPKPFLFEAVKNSIAGKIFFKLCPGISISLAL